MNAGIKYVFIITIDPVSLPEMERWYMRFHAPEAIYQLGPWLTFYRSYRVVPPMYGAEKYGYYNYRVTELGFRSATDLPRPILTPGRGGVFSLTWPTSFKNMSTERMYDNQFHGEGQPCQCFVPTECTDDFMGGERTVDEKTILRWYQVFRYPEGVSVEEGEDWYLNVHANEVMQQPGLTRFFSHRTIDVPGSAPYPWHRLSELWYENFDGWRRSVIDSPPKYTEPAWARYDEYPFFEPFSDFVSTFVLETPTNNLLRELRSYP